MNDSFDAYIDTITRNDIFGPEPNSLVGQLISPLISQERMLQTRLEMRFEEINFDSRTVLDIGAGTGLFSAYAAHNGAKRVVALEPEIEGSSAGMIDTLENIASEYPSIDVKKKTLQEYNPNNGAFDVVFSNNSINHLDEEACVSLQSSRQARETYHEIFEKLNDVTELGGSLIVADAFRRNFWNDFGVTNPFITLEWNKHQSPKLWSSMLNEHGFKEYNLIWDSYLSQLGTIGKRVLSNYPLSYLTYSKFILKMRKTHKESS